MGRAKVTVMVIGVVMLARPAMAQSGATTSRERGAWEVEAHIGGAMSPEPTSGVAALPDAGPSFTTMTSRPSRRVSSWFVGDGAQLLNDALRALGSGAQIAPLDAAVKGRVVERPSGLTIGARVSRRLTSRLSAEFAVESGQSRLRFSQAARDSIDRSLSTFRTAWQGLLATGPFTSTDVTSTSVVPGEGGRQVLLTGAVEIALSARTRVQPYAIAGAGVARNTGEAPVATLSGTYQFLIFGAAPVRETDSIAIRASVPRSTPVGVFGGGARVHLSPRWGIRGDVRVHVGRNRIDTLLDETPFTQTVTAPMAVIASGTTPSIQFRNFSTPGAGQGNGQNTFSGDPISGFKTFTGTGAATSVNLTVGAFWRW